MRLLLIIFLALSSCTKKEESWGAVTMWLHALKQDPSIELVAIPNHESRRRVLCSMYRQDGCIDGSGKRIRVRLVELLTIQYESKKQACEAAKAIGQWYARNWLFDDVTKEPVLETFVKKVFDAKKPESRDSCD